MVSPFVIAIDGPSASGKGTLARRLGEYFGLRHIDSGLMYRAVAREMLTHNFPLDDSVCAVEVAGSLDFSALNKSELSTDSIALAAADVASLVDLRKYLVEIQRSYASVPPGVVMDGRDIGTVVFPDADTKIFVTADVSVRASRRYDELRSLGVDTDYDTILRDLESRDLRDKEREASPLYRAENSYLCDTTKMDIQTAFEFVLSVVLEHDKAPRAVSED